MKRVFPVLICVAAVIFVAAGKRQEGWSTPYLPTRLEWLALQCGIQHRQTSLLVHSTFVAVAPNKINAVVKYAKDAKPDAETRKAITDSAKAYVQGIAKAHGWTDPLIVEAIEIQQ